MIEPMFSSSMNSVIPSLSFYGMIGFVENGTLSMPFDWFCLGSIFLCRHKQPSLCFDFFRVSCMSQVRTIAMIRLLLLVLFYAFTSAAWNTVWQSILDLSLCTVVFMSRPEASDCSWCFCRSSLWVFGSWLFLSISFEPSFPPSLA